MPDSWTIALDGLLGCQPLLRDRAGSERQQFSDLGRASLPHVRQQRAHQHGRLDLVEYGPIPDGGIPPFSLRRRAEWSIHPAESGQGICPLDDVPICHRQADKRVFVRLLIAADLDSPDGETALAFHQSGEPCQINVADRQGYNPDRATSTREAAGILAIRIGPISREAIGGLLDSALGTTAVSWASNRTRFWHDRPPNMVTTFYHTGR